MKKKTIILSIKNTMNIKTGLTAINIMNVMKMNIILEMDIMIVNITLSIIYFCEAEMCSESWCSSVCVWLVAWTSLSILLNIMYEEVH